MRIEPLGDAALLVRFEEPFDPDTSLEAVIRATRQLEKAAIPGMIELAPAYTTVGVFFDPARSGPVHEIKAAIERALKRNPQPPDAENGTRMVEMPVCYEGDLAPDLDEVARHAGLSRDNVIERHSAAGYRVSCVGFTPGFPYLSGLPTELATPRRSSPRKQVPAGAVAIGGTQTGIYPRKSPGGWNIIGRTPLLLFDVQANPPALLQPGDRVQFRRISRREFEQLLT